ncbi:hypothetical protein SAMN05660199_00494 [Klenkia soli]|uniref:Mce-associated membrane protein n=1 Tax=Klenkia soli TaxID=1052260 RepID=A0A1H0D4F3_9ACTN|nr:hypothetical protein [Klenkia soli]SDN64781.1 hypothetical protein SAMN05660199_00494 [Klenkia soli]
MTDDAGTTSDGDATRPRPRPTPRPRGAAARPSPRPRVAGSRRAEDEADQPDAEAPARRPVPAPRARTATPAPLPRNRPRPAAAPASSTVVGTDGAAEDAGTRTGRTKGRKTRPTKGRTARSTGAAPRRSRTLALVLALLCVLVAAGGGWLLWQRTHPTSVDPAIFAAARSGVEDVYAYDYQDSDGSVQRKLDALTGDLRDQYESDLSSGGIISTYEQVSATTSYDVLEVGLQQVNDSQDQATLVVFGQYVVKSVNSGTQAAPTGSECTVTDDGAQSCTQTVRVTVLKVDGAWKISELTLLTSS